MKALCFVVVLFATTVHAQLQVCQPGFTCCEECAGGGGGGNTTVCYETKVAVPQLVSVTDAYGTHGFRIDYLRRLCAPIAPAPLDGPHAVAYSGIDSLPAPNVAVSYTTPLGIISGTLSARIRYLMTSAEKTVPPALPGPLTRHELRTCYPLTRPHPSIPVTWTDQFGPHLGKVQESAFVCTPATGAGLSSTSTVLCFFMSVNGPDANVNLTAPFGPDRAAIDHTDNWCVPATPLP